MDIQTVVSLVLNAFQALSVIWILFFGTKTVVDVAKGQSSKISRITVVSLMIALVVLIVASGFYLILRKPLEANKPTQPTSSITPTAQPADEQTTLSYFCSFIQAHDFDPAYQLYSDDYQQKVSASDFQRKWDGNYDSCIPKITSSSGSRAESTITLTDFFSKQTTVYTVTLVRNRNNYWRIDNVSP